MKQLRWLAACASFVCCMGVAYAHAFLDHARPAVGSTVRGSVSEVRLWFSVPLDPASSTVKVLDSAGRQVDRNDKQVDSSDATLLKVSVPRLAPGKYRVLWSVRSVDTHPADGDFAFEIAPEPLAEGQDRH